MTGVVLEVERIRWWLSDRGEELTASRSVVSTARQERLNGEERAETNVENYERRNHPELEEILCEPPSR